MSVASHFSEADMCEQCINLEHRLELAQAEVVELQERVAYAEQGRDNISAQRDEVQARAKEKGAMSGRIISSLVDLVRRSGSPELNAQVRVILSPDKSNEAKTT